MTSRMECYFEVMKMMNFMTADVAANLNLGKESFEFIRVHESSKQARLEADKLGIWKLGEREENRTNPVTTCIMEYDNTAVAQSKMLAGLKCGPIRPCRHQWQGVHY